MIGRRLIFWSFAPLCAAALIFGGAIWYVGYIRAVEQVSARSQSDLALAVDRLRAQLQRYQELAVLMANHPTLVTLTHEGASDLDRKAAERILRAAADKTGAVTLAYVDTRGNVLASATRDRLRNIPQASYFQRAMTGALGVAHGFDPVFQIRSYYYAAPYFGPRRAVDAALIVVVDVGRIESQWRGTRPTVYFVDEGGEVFISNRSEILGWRRDVGEVGLHPPDEVDYTSVRVSLLADTHEVWHVNWGPYVPDHALHLVADLPTIGLQAEALVDLTSARRIALLQAVIAGSSLMFFGLVSLFFVHRRQALAEANVRLERSVQERTIELRRAQDDLVRAGKLSALGQMSAGISHELNQPLMAIQQYADNAVAFMKKDKFDTVTSNLTQITQLSKRMARIIKNLRAFARNEHEPMGRVDVVSVVDTALELMNSRCQKDEISVEWDAPDHPIYVVAGEVRLGQVVVNLISNAADAMAGSDRRVIRICVTQGQAIQLSVSDTGPGIDEPEKMFDPFYSTKTVGDGDGMGLGLSISYGLVQSFGGDIRGENTGEGAKMTVELQPFKGDA